MLVAFCSPHAVTPIIIVRLLRITCRRKHVEERYAALRFFTRHRERADVIIIAFARHCSRARYADSLLLPSYLRRYDAMLRYTPRCFIIVYYAAEMPNAR